MRLTSLADYSVVILAAAARHPAGARLTASGLAGETGVPLPTAQKLMGRLAAAGLLSSARGTGGGFALARDAQRISLADIIEAVEGPIAMTNCVEGAARECGLERACGVRPHMGIVNGAVREALAGVSLSQLSCAPAKAGARPSAAWTPAFAGERP
ncbi:MAG: Rrf2 family transcriptional regulator [Pseudomonadota bacterium]|nr:Rrf2 family transcriptional regulator [Pseudomonadota bacterium]